MIIRSARREDAAQWAKMRAALWLDDHTQEVAAYFEGRLHEPLEVLLAFDDAGQAIGFVELSIRNYAEGCDTNHVGYLEGWFVEESARRTGVGRALVLAAQQWARTQGCTEFASDTEWDNAVSEAAHKALGFEETDRIICFKKNL